MIAVTGVFFTLSVSSCLHATENCEAHNTPPLLSHLFDWGREKVNCSASTIRQIMDQNYITSNIDDNRFRESLQPSIESTRLLHVNEELDLEIYSVINDSRDTIKSADRGTLPGYKTTTGGL